MIWKLQPMATVPRDRPVLLLTKLGIISAWFSPGEWQDYFESREYKGAQWVCYDDAVQIDIEEISRNHLEDIHDGVLGWYELPELPPGYQMPSREGLMTVPSPATIVGDLMQEDLRETRRILKMYHDDLAKRHERERVLVEKVKRIADELSQHVDEQYPEASLGWCLDELRALSVAGNESTHSSPKADTLEILTELVALRDDPKRSNEAWVNAVYQTAREHVAAMQRQRDEQVTSQISTTELAQRAEPLPSGD